MADNYITCLEEKGAINISDEVIATMVRIAVKEVDGVAGMAVTAGPAVTELLSKKTSSKGVKVSFGEESISIDAMIMVKYGSNVVNVATTVQETVMNHVQDMTGIDDVTVNVHVSGIAFEK
jgi:uncharacterized alkaline shock family protein YloU